MNGRPLYGRSVLPLVLVGVVAFTLVGLGLLFVGGQSGDYAAAAATVETPQLSPEVKVLLVTATLAVVVSGMVSWIQPVEEGEDV
jgi:hypothetical protein